MNTKQCAGCAYRTEDKIGCDVFERRPLTCWAYATPEEKAKREAAIDEYSILKSGRLSRNRL